MSKKHSKKPCLLADEEGEECDEQPLVRGLCGRHRKQWERTREQEFDNEEDRLKFDNDLICEGLLLPKEKPGPKPKRNLFRETAIMLKAIRERETTQTENRGASTGAGAIVSVVPPSEANKTNEGEMPNMRQDDNGSPPDR